MEQIKKSFVNKDVRKLFNIESLNLHTGLGEWSNADFRFAYVLFFPLSFSFSTTSDCYPLLESGVFFIKRFKCSLKLWYHIKSNVT